MNVLDVLTKEDLMKAPEIRDGRNHGGYNLTASYIKRHGRELGGHSKPMLFDRELVELFLRERFWKERLEEEAKSETAKAMLSHLNSTVVRIREQVRRGRAA